MKERSAGSSCFMILFIGSDRATNTSPGGPPSWHAFAYSFLLFSLIFWSWVSGSQYYDLHGNDSVRTRIFTFLQMLAMAAIAITIEDSFDGHHRGLQSV